MSKQELKKFYKDDLISEYFLYILIVDPEKALTEHNLQYKKGINPIKVIEYFFHLGWRPDPDSNLIYCYISNGFKDDSTRFDKYCDTFQQGYVPNHDMVKYLSSIGFNGDGVLELTTHYEYIKMIIKYLHIYKKY